MGPHRVISPCSDHRARLKSNGFQSSNGDFGKESKEFYNLKYQAKPFKRHLILDRMFVRAIVSKYRISFESSAIDVGCGTGWYSHLLAEHSQRVVGVDISRSAILRAKGEWKEKQIDWVIGDARNLSFNDAFDVVFCSGLSLFNVPDLKASTGVARNLLNCLKSEGVFIFIESSNLSRKKTTVVNHSLRQVSDFLTDLDSATVLGIFALNVQLLPLLGGKALSSFFTKLTSALVKIHRKSCRIVCISRKL